MLLHEDHHLHAAMHCGETTPCKQTTKQQEAEKCSPAYHVLGAHWSISKKANIIHCSLGAVGSYGHCVIVREENRECLLNIQWQATRLFPQVVSDLHADQHTVQGSIEKGLSVLGCEGLQHEAQREGVLPDIVQQCTHLCMQSLFCLLQYSWLFVPGFGSTSHVHLGGGGFHCMLPSNPHKCLRELVGHPPALAREWQKHHRLASQPQLPRQPCRFPQHIVTAVTMTTHQPCQNLPRAAQGAHTLLSTPSRPRSAIPGQTQNYNKLIATPNILLCCK